MNTKSSFVLPVAAAATVAIFASCKPAPTPESAKETPQPAAAAPSATPAAAATPAYVSTSGLDLKDPVATVNGEPISLADLDKAFNTAIASAGVKPDDLSPEQKIEGYRQLLDEMVMEKLISKASEGETVSDEEVDAELNKIKTQFPSEEEFNKQLTEAGQTPEKVRESIKSMLVQQKWMESKMGSTEVTPEETQKFYDENQAEFQEPESVKASHILFLVKQDDPEDVVKAKLAAAKKAITRAKKEDFTKLAKELSEEPGASESGGDLGFFSKDRMVPEFAEASFAQKVGTVSTEPVRTQFGWHVIKVTDKKPAGTLPYDQVKDQLAAFLKNDKQRKAAQDVIKSLQDSAKIETSLPPEQQPALPTAPGAVIAPEPASAPAAAVEESVPAATPAQP